MNPFRPLATENLAKKQKTINKDVDKLACHNRFKGDSEHRRLHDALTRKQREQMGRGLAIVALGFWVGLCLSMQA